MDRRGKTATDQGNFGKLKGKLVPIVILTPFYPIADVLQKMSKGDGSKDGGQQGIELSDMTNNSSTRPTGSGRGAAVRPSQSTAPAASPGILPQPQIPAPLPTFQRQMPIAPRQDGSGLPPIRDVGQLVRRYRLEQFTVVGACATDKPELSPIMGSGWTKDHDRFICYMDREGVPVDDMGRRIKQYLGDIRGGIPPPAQVDCRLRYLDQIPEIDYW